MPAFCLLPKVVENFKKALRSGEIDPVKFAEMTSAQRRDALAKHVGIENSKEVNALFESKLLLKNRQQGYISWAKKVSGITPEARRDIISRIEKMQDILDPKAEQKFLNDLASKRLKVEITEGEAKTLADLSKKAEDLRAKADENGKFPSENDRIAYGTTQLNLENYFNNLKLQSRNLGKGKADRIKDAVFEEIPGTMKSLVASLDNSFFGRQGIKTVLDVRTSGIWLKNFLKSWKDIGKELAGKDAMEAIKADIYSRPNALNGKYKAGKFGLDVLSEEAFPSSLPARIPLLGRLYRASESAYNGAALRMRADLADRLIKKAEENGLNMLDPKQAEGVGSLISSLTGRGGLGKGEVLAKEANILLFSIKFLKANFDTLTAHTLDSKVQRNAFAKKEARKNLINIVTTVAAVLTIAKMIDPNSVDEDPRSSNFGKIKIFGQWTDITGGMGSMVTLASRLVPTWHNGKLSWWYKNKAGSYTETGLGGYGKMTPLDVLESYFQGKLSPALGLLRDQLRRETFEGEKPTIENQAKQITIPISAQSFNKLMKDPNAESVLGSMILEGLGFSISSSSQKEKNWSSNPTKAQQAFLEKVGQDKFQQANDEYNQQYNEWFNTVSESDEYKALSDESKQKLTTQAKDDIQIKIFKKYRFKYKDPKKTKEEKKEAKTIKNLLPN